MAAHRPAMTLVGVGAFINPAYDGGSATVGRANVGRARLHPDDRPEGRPLGVFALTNGVVDLSKVPAQKAFMRRTEHEDAPALKARLKRESRHRNR